MYGPGAPKRRQVTGTVSFEFLPVGGGEELRCRCNDNFSCSSATQAAPDDTAHASKPAPESGRVIVQADVHRPAGEHDKGMKSKSRLTGPTSPLPSGRNSTETVPVSSLCLAAGQGAEGAAAVGGGPAGFTFVNGTVAAAT